MPHIWNRFYICELFITHQELLFAWIWPQITANSSIFMHSAVPSLYPHFLETISSLLGLHYSPLVRTESLHFSICQDVSTASKPKLSWKWENAADFISEILELVPLASLALNTTESHWPWYTKTGWPLDYLKATLCYLLFRTRTSRHVNTSIGFSSLLKLTFLFSLHNFGNLQSLKH